MTLISLASDLTFSWHETNIMHYQMPASLFEPRPGRRDQRTIHTKKYDLMELYLKIKRQWKINKWKLNHWHISLGFIQVDYYQE